MSELLQSATALPNLHPAVVHFPIALVPTAILFDLMGLLTRQRWLARAGALLWALAALGTGAAYWAGKQAADSLIGVAPRVQAQIATHSDWGLYTLWAVGVVAVARLLVAAREHRGEANPRGSRWALVAAGAAVLGLVVWTADLGGALVYRHGVAVEVARAATEGESEHPDHEPAPSSHPQGAPAASDSAIARLVERADGTLVWSPLPTDAAALGSVLLPAPGSSLAPIRAEEPGEDVEGLRLAVDGEAMLLLPGTFGDVQLDAVVDLTAFDGTLALVHHARAADSAGLFSVSTSGSAALIVLGAGSRKVLDEQQATVPEGPVELAVSSSGRHLKGLVEGKTVAHGHVAPGEDGGCGLLLSGSGSVTIITLRLTPLT